MTHSYGDNGAVLEGGLHHLLNEAVRLHVDRRGRLVHDQDARVAQEGSRQAEQLENLNIQHVKIGC